MWKSCFSLAPLAGKFYLFIFVCCVAFSICSVFCFLSWNSFWMSIRLPSLLLHSSIALNFYLHHFHFHPISSKNRDICVHCNTSSPCLTQTSHRINTCSVKEWMSACFHPLSLCSHSGNFFLALTSIFNCILISVILFFIHKSSFIFFHSSFLKEAVLLWIAILPQISLKILIGNS